jgi:hypothetical protein
VVNYATEQREQGCVLSGDGDNHPRGAEENPVVLQLVGRTEQLDEGGVLEISLITESDINLAASSREQTPSLKGPPSTLYLRPFPNKTQWFRKNQLSERAPTPSDQFDMRREANC